MDHNQENAANSANDPYPFARGYWQVAANPHFRTVMSYATPTCQSPDCEQIARFSTPLKTFQGVVTGVANSADNVRMLGIGAPLVAAYKTQPPPPPPPTCVETATASCINQRFKVEATWETKTGSGPARRIAVAGNAVALAFGPTASMDLVVKVVNDCAINHRFSVLIGGPNFARVTIKVTDTKANKVKTYSSPRVGKPFQMIQDLAAFATCP